MLYSDVILTGFPNATESDMDEVLFGRTAYPFKAITVKELYRASNRLYRAEKNGRALCSFCDREVPVGHGACESCDLAIHPIDC